MSEVYVHEPSTSGKVVLHTSLGDLDVELWSRECPVACRNFLQLCCEGYYNGLIFHRVIKDFIVQTGDPTGTGRGGSDTAVNNGKLFDLEIHPRLKFRYRGLVGVANLTGAFSAGVAGGRGCGINGNQFFITLSRCDALNNTHTLFGKVTGHTLYNLMKFGELEVDKNDRPVCPPVIKGVDVLWMPFADIQPRVEVQQQQQQQKKSSSSRRGDGEEDEGSASREEQQKIKLQKPDKKLLSFAEEEEEEEEEGGENAAAEGKKEQLCGEKSTTSNSSSRIQGDSRSTGAGSSKKILSAHDVLEDDPLLQRSSGVEPEAAAVEKGRRSGGRKADDGAFSSDEEEEEERVDVGSQQRKRKRSSSRRRSSNSRYSSEDDSSSSEHSRDAHSRRSSSSRGGSISRRRSGSSREGRAGSSRKDGGGSGSSSTLMLVRNKLAALGALDGGSSSRRQQRPAGGAAADAGGGGGEAAAVPGSRRYSEEENNDSSSSRGGRSSSSSSHAQQQHQRGDKEGRRKVEALRLWSGGGSASRGAHADRERLQDSDLMTDREKKRQLYVLRRRDNERQRQQTETLDKLNAFTQQLRSLRERQSSSSSSGSGGKDKSGDSSCAGMRKENGAKPTYAGGEEKALKKTAEAGTLNAMLPDLDEEIDENDGSWLSGGGLRFAVDSNRAYELDEARAAASVVVYDPLRGAGDVAAKKMQQRRQQQAVGWKEGRRDIEKW